MSSVFSTQLLRTVSWFKPLAFAVLIIAGSPHAIGDEAKCFVTLPASPFQKTPTPQQMEEAQRAKESRPAAQDPEGHWGKATEGFQLSVRFEQESFRAGEPVVAAVIIRNVSDRKVFYREYMISRKDSSAFQFDVLDERQHPVDRLDPKAPDDITDGPHATLLLNPGTQSRYQVKLGEKFNFSQPGKYTVRARCWVHNLDRDGYTQLQSDQAPMTILPAPTGQETQTARLTKKTKDK